MTTTDPNAIADSMEATADNLWQDAEGMGRQANALMQLANNNRIRATRLRETAGSIRALATNPPAEPPVDNGPPSDWPEIPDDARPGMVYDAERNHVAAFDIINYHSSEISEFADCTFKKAHIGLSVQQRQHDAQIGVRAWNCRFIDCNIDTIGEDTIDEHGLFIGSTMRKDSILELYGCAFIRCGISDDIAAQIRDNANYRDGGIYCSLHGQRVILKDCVFIDCFSKGAKILVWDSVSIERCAFLRNGMGFEMGWDGWRNDRRAITGSVNDCLFWNMTDLPAKKQTLGNAGWFRGGTYEFSRNIIANPIDLIPERGEQVVLWVDNLADKGEPLAVSVAGGHNKSYGYDKPVKYMGTARVEDAADLAFSMYPRLPEDLIDTDDISARIESGDLKPYQVYPMCKAAVEEVGDE